MTERIGWWDGCPLGVTALNRWAWPLILWLVALLTLALLTVHLLTYPAPWFDEGLNLATARNLAETGQYALPDSAGPRLFDPAIQSGPLIILPVALVFRLVGPDLLAARALMVGFGLLALLGFGLLAHSLLGRTGALLAVLFLLAGNSNTYTSFVPLARHALGEVPALGLLAVSFWRWQQLTLRKHRNLGGFALTGLGFGLAMNTKSQVLVVFTIMWLVYALADRLYYRQVSLSAFIMPGCAAMAVLGTWYLVQWALLPPDVLAANVKVLREGFATHIVSLNLTHLLHALRALWSIQFLVWGAPGVVYALWLARPRTRAGVVWAGPALFVTLWLSWFTLGSIGWERYAFVGAAFAMLGTAALLRDLLRFSQRSRRPQLMAGLVLALTLTLLAFNGRTTLIGVMQPRPDHYSAFIQLLDSQVPLDAVVETSEWELSVNTTRRLHHPPTTVVNQVTRVLQSGSTEQYSIARRPRLAI